MMETLKRAFTVLRRYTSTQLLLCSSLLLVVLTPLFGVVFSAGVTACYIVTRAAWSVNVKPLASKLTAATLYRGSAGQDYADARHELDHIKRRVSEAFVLSWTSALDLDQVVEQSVVDAASELIEALVSLVTTKQVNVYSAITDLIKGAHLHILRYNVAKIEPLPRKHIKLPQTKISTKARFLELSHTDWSRVHEDTQTDILRTVTEQILCRYLPVKEPSPLALEALTAIISENVLTELLWYLSKQENLLKLVIRVLSYDFEVLLKTAEIDNSALSETKMESEKERMDKSIALEDLQDAGELNDSHHHELILEGDNSDGSAHEKEICEDLAVPADVESVSSPDTDAETSSGVLQDSGDEYVSADIMKYFRVAPSTPSKQLDKPETVAAFAAATPTQESSLLNPHTSVPALSVLANCSKLSLHGANNSDPKRLPMIAMSPAKMNSAVTAAVSSTVTAAVSSTVTAAVSSTVNEIDNTQMLLKKLSMTMIRPALRDARESSPEVDDIRPKAVPMMLMTPAAEAVKQSAVVISRQNSLGQIKGADSQSIDSGLSDEMGEESFERSAGKVPSKGLAEGKKFLSIGIPTTENHTEKQSHVKYTLYVITYRAVYQSESPVDSLSIREFTLYRRYREFMNLRARLEKYHQYSKVLKSVSGPSWWRQLSLGTLKPREIEKRRKQLETFLQQLVAQPIINESKDLEEFLAYNGNAEIEFVQEKVEFIPRAARLDKVVIKTVSGMVGKVTDKLTSQSHGGSPDGRRFSEATNHKKSKQGDVTGKEELKSAVFSLWETVESNLLPLRERQTDRLRSPEFKPEATKSPKPTICWKDDNYYCQKLADSLFQIVLLLLQSHCDLSKNSNIVSSVSVVLIPYLTRWLKNKVSLYGTPPEITSLLVLFRKTLWPEKEEIDKQYDINILKELARQCIVNEVPSPVSALMESEINRIFNNVLRMTEHTEVNEQLGYTLLNQLLQNSLKALVGDMIEPKQ